MVYTRYVSSSAPVRRTKLEKEEPADSDDIKELKTPNASDY